VVAMDILTDPLFAMVFYGSCVLIAFGLAWASSNAALARLGFIAGAHWIVYEGLLLSGWDNPVLIVAMSSAAAALSAWLGWGARYVAVATAALWIAAALIATAFFYYGAQKSMTCYLLLNATFMGRMFVLGGAGIGELAGWDGHLLHGHSVRGHGHAGTPPPRSRT